MKPARPIAWLVLARCAALLASCASGPVRRVSEPAARIQQLTVQADGRWDVELRLQNFSSIPTSVQADGRWDVELRLQNFSSIPMRFDVVELQLGVAGQDAGTLAAS